MSIKVPSSAGVQVPPKPSQQGEKAENVLRTEPAQGPIKWAQVTRKGGANVVEPLSEAEREALLAQSIKGTLENVAAQLKSGVPLQAMQRITIGYLLQAYEVTHPELVEQSGVRKLLAQLDQASVQI